MVDGGSYRHGGPRVRHALAPALILEKRLTWSPEAEAGLAKTFGFDRDAVVRGVNTGDLELWCLDGGRAWLVTKVEDGELVVVCFQGRDARRVTKLLFNIARRNRLAAVRFFTRHRALPRLLAGFGFEQLETIYRAPVPAEPLAIERVPS